ncbi:hypothetical protein F8154_10815 [Alkaliphilus pronyensis]|uniref:N-acetyltransferase domain-containing protein n=1 Tax=Alkaliphilus pronyensis TaxID=1482732 RepID=A0A6I0F3L6_9FIRM|nr:hypothetical protein [Alkaliphilus pronyensis]KAB3533485.1 hypothetical protein F8154_10815 [Alkaliphilus pronyensis]
MEYQIRGAEAKDAEELSRLIYEYYETWENQQLFLEYYKEEALRIRLEKGIEKGFVAVKDNKAIGLIFYTDNGFHVNMTQIILKKNISYGAVAASLARTAYNSLNPEKGFRKVIASTEDFNETSMIMLIKLGFLPEAFIRHGYSKNVHQIVWTLYIGEGEVEDYELYR